MDFRGFVASFKDVFFYKMLERSILTSASVLDVGCGSNSPIRTVKKTSYREGIDIYKESLEESKKNKIHDKYVHGDIQKLNEYYKPKSFDVVVALDVIEHLEKRHALRLIKDMETIARKKIIILTPNGFCDQGHYGNNPYQDHKSGWSKKDLGELGYKVYGLRSLRYLRGEFATIKFKPWLLWGFIAFITEPLLYYFPSFSYHLFAVKTLIDEK